ncbi:right-handed parallel beta-helix repeat-containing protein [Nannocystis bainbridge]|uniref:Right-handed parallel beta-helix repeat-containing protein n=1 Tax=Nannocystis bainbridge TaxID=2995303 RepID=A0ABT5E0T6_9BACT|nr:right-handed parallel beta-helix repeat-containing protein [Nannocystis bainbridge]MDC0719487.1 right-handed parallel beta-helix repeat-containing protein [Nannocystis bainbridge]
MRISLLCRGLGFGLGFLAAACTPGGPQTETSSESDSDACQPGSLNCVCEANGCDPGLVCASGFCVEDGSGSSEATLTTSTSSPTSATETDPGTTDPTGPTVTTETPQCDDGPGVSQQCPETAPYCLAEGVCADCSGLTSCADIDAGAPACDAASGLCVECTEADASACGGNTPVCDAADNTCAACTDHEQCPSGACNIATGACFEDALWVDGQADCGGDGSEDAPFCEIQDAIAVIGTGKPTVVHVKPGPSYKTKIDVGSNLVVAIVGDGPSPAIDVDVDALLVNDDARVYLKDLRFIGSSMSAGNALVCLNAEVWADKVEFSSRESVAIDTIGCALQIRRSRVYANQGGGIRIDKGQTRIENSFITSNGGNFAQYGGIHVVTGDLDVVYSSIIGNNSDANADSLHCNDPGTIRLRNVVLFGQSQLTSVTCDGATVSDSLVDSSVLAGRNVTVEGAAQSAWFENAAGGDFHAKAGAPFAELGRWRTGDPAVDYDGDPRPDVDMSPDWAGADRLP